jgi:hypothetical protein
MYELAAYGQSSVTGRPVQALTRRITTEAGRSHGVGASALEWKLRTT